jgi:hypothetical protein
MARTDHTRAPHTSRRATRDGLTTTRQPRPTPRRQSTRRQAVLAATRER